MWRRRPIFHLSDHAHVDMHGSLGWFTLAAQSRAHMCDCMLSCRPTCRPRVGPSVVAHMLGASRSRGA